MSQTEVKFCPKCGSVNVNFDSVGFRIWKCNDCGYSSDIFPEKSKLNKKMKQEVMNKYG